MQPRQRAQYWGRTKHLGHGALVALWIERPGGGRGQQGAPPILLFGVVCERDTDKLAPQDNGRPQLGIM